SALRQQLALPPSADRLLADWSAVFEGTARCAEYWRRIWSETPAGLPAGLNGLPATAEPHVLALLQASRAQSEAFARQLDDLADSFRQDRRDETAEPLVQAAAESRAAIARVTRLVSGDRPGYDYSPPYAQSDNRVQPSWSDPLQGGSSPAAP